MTQSLDAALAEWRDAFGESHVVTSTELRHRASTATFPTSSKVLAILSPGNREEVQACMRISNRFKVPVYPISRGRNWGLGSRVPPRDSVLLDLSRLNRIVDYDPHLGYMSIEPGVTFQQAADFLREQESSFFLPVIGGSPLGSIVGNIAERGEGAGPYGQRLDFVANIEAILATGGCIHSGFGRFPSASSKHVHRYGVGPGVESLLTQSNLALITQLTVWLTPYPQVLKPFLAHIPRRDDLAPAIDAARMLLLQRIVEANGIGIWNSIKVSSTLGSYPWETMKGRTPLDPQRFPSEPWILGGAIYSASSDVAEATGQLVQQQLSPFVEHWQWCDASDSDNAYLGVPTEQNIRCAYWRKKTGLPANLDPDADRCGLIWICFAVPLIGDQLRQAVDVVEPIIYRYGLEPNIGLNCISGRCAHLYVSLIYDREVAGEDASAVACHDEVVQALRDQGHLPYRLGLLSMSALPDASDDYPQWLRAIKNAMDPNHILAPGRYETDRPGSVQRGT